MVIICKLIIFGVPLWALYILLKPHNQKNEVALLNESAGDTRAGRKNTASMRFLGGLCMLGIIILFEWGMFFLYLGCQKNAHLSRIRRNGTRMEAQVVGCKLNEEYSAGSVVTYTYYVDFVVNKQVRRGATMSFLYYPEGSIIDIYYLPYQNGILGGVALVGDSGNLGKVKINQGILGIIAALFLLFLWTNIRKVNDKYDTKEEEE